VVSDDAEFFKSQSFNQSSHDGRGVAGQVLELGESRVTKGSSPVPEGDRYGESFSAVLPTRGSRASTILVEN